MELWIAIILDILTAALVVVPIIFGIVRGLKRQLLSVISLAVSAVAAFACATLITDTLYENYIKEPVTDACITAVEEIDPVSYADQLLAEQGISIPEDELREKLADSGDAVAEAKRIAEENGLSEDEAYDLSRRFSERYTKDAPEEVRKAIPGVMKKIESIELKESQVIDLLNSAASSPQEGGEYAEEHLVRPTAIQLLKAAVFAAAFILMQLIMLIIYLIMRFDLKAHGEGAASRFGGLLLGIIAGAGNAAVFCLLIRYLEKASLGLFMTDDLPSKVFLPVFKFLF